jgi:peroxiredoxin
MNKPVILLLAVATIAAGGLFAYVRLGGPARPTGKVAFVEPEKHRVTVDMLASTATMTEKSAPSFRLRATDGTTYALDELARETPVVLAFIKDGCPCSTDAQRYFNRLHEAYGHEIRFLGVIDVDPDKARAWGQQNRTTFPLVTDPGLGVMRDYKADSSAYVAVIAKGGAIDRLYPGYSESMLAEISDRLARLAGIPPRPIDASGAPDELSTGCPFH